jgi:hypothetical protein
MGQIVGKSNQEANFGLKQGILADDGSAYALVWRPPLHAADIGQLRSAFSPRADFVSSRADGHDHFGSLQFRCLLLLPESADIPPRRPDVR